MLTSTYKGFGPLAPKNNPRMLTSSYKGFGPLAPKNNIPSSVILDLNTRLYVDI
jgi:hypothetical protein